ncbi:MAG: cobalamin-binding protein, partial [Bacteroidota bacterium]
MKIVSLLPSATEIVCGLGLRDQLVGVTHECDFPESVQVLPKVTETLIPSDASSAEIDQLVSERMASEPSLYKLDMEQLVELAPDLVVTQELCNVCAVPLGEVEQVFERMAIRPRLVNLSPTKLEDLYASIQEVGRVAEVPEIADQYLGQLRRRVATVVSRVTGRSRPHTALLEWLDPPFSAGHWNPELVRLAGGIDGLNVEGAPSRRLGWAEVIDYAPEVIVIACCGFSTERAKQDLPIAEAVPGWTNIPAVRDDRVYFFDGSQFFNRPGPRLVDSLEMLAEAI